MREEMSVVAMVGQHVIVGSLQCPHDRDLTEFLAQARMGRSGEEPLAEKFQQELLGKPNQMTDPIDRGVLERDQRWACRTR